MVMRCGAPFCMQQPGCGASFYPFPERSDSNRRRLWMRRLLVSDEEWSSSKLIACDRHFSKAQFTKTARGRHLSRGAVPDQFVVPVNIDSCKVLDNVCRFCLETSGNRMETISPSQNKPEIPTVEDIRRIFDIEINPEDKIPQLICVTCLSKINYIKRIRNQFKENDKKLRQMLLVATPPSQQKLKVVAEYPSSSTAVKSEPPDASDEYITSLEQETGSYMLDEHITIIKRIADNSNAGESKSDDEAYQENQLISGDQITIMAEDVEIESIAIKNEHIEDRHSDDNDPHRLFTGDIEPPNDEHIKKQPTIEEFETLDVDDSQSDEPEVSPGKKHRTYRPFRYTKRRRNDGV